MGQSNPHRRVDCPTYLMVTVAILLECNLEKLAQTFSSMHQGWMDGDECQSLGKAWCGHFCNKPYEPGSQKTCKYPNP
jgi:hypothetical protein